MKLFLDECVPLPTRKFLRERGHQLITVEELGRSSAPNGEVISLARQHKVALVTADRGLGDLRTFSLGTHPGIVVLKIQRPDDIDAVHRHLLAALETIPPKQLAG